MIRAFAHDGIVVSVDAPTPDLAWLEEFVSPAFTMVSPGSDDVRVSFEATADSTVDGHGRADRAAFTLDSSPIRLAELPIPDGTRLHDARRGVTFDVTHGGRHVRIGYSASRLDARMRLMRVVREYAHNHSVRTRGLMLHAAAVKVAGRAVAIAGPKGAGKTTLALKLLAVPGVDYLSNDRLLVRLEDRPHAFAVPTVVALKKGTRALMPDLTARIRDCGDFREHSDERGARGPSAPVMAGDEWHVGPRQLCVALDRPLQPSAPLSALLFPSSDHPSRQRVRRLATFEAIEALKNSPLCRRTGDYTSDVFVAEAGFAPTDDQIDSYCRDLASRIACVACAWSADASIDDLSMLIDACLERRA